MKLEVDVAGTRFFRVVNQLLEDERAEASGASGPVGRVGRHSWAVTIVFLRAGSGGNADFQTGSKCTGRTWFERLRYDGRLPAWKSATRQAWKLALRARARVRP